MERISQCGEQIVKLWACREKTEEMECLAAGTGTEVIITDDLKSNEGAPTYWTVIPDGDKVRILSYHNEDDEHHLVADAKNHVLLKKDAQFFWTFEEAENFPYVYLVFESSKEKKMYLSPGDDDLNSVILRDESDKLNNRWLYHVFRCENPQAIENDENGENNAIAQTNVITQVGQQNNYHVSTSSDAQPCEREIINGGNQNSIFIGGNRNTGSGTQTVGDVAVKTGETSVQFNNNIGGGDAITYKTSSSYVPPRERER